MEWKTLNFGTYVNVGDGDDLHTAFTKVESNLNYVKYTQQVPENIGTGVGISTMRFVGAYDQFTTYYPGDVIFFGDKLYKNLQQCTSIIPTNTTYYSLLAKTFRGVFSSTVRYNANDVVFDHFGNPFVALRSSYGNPLTDISSFVPYVGDYTLKSISSGNDNLVISSDDHHVIITAIDSINSLHEDSTPTLSTNLNTNGFGLYHTIDGLFSDLGINDVTFTTDASGTVIRSPSNITISAMASVTIEADIVTPSLVRCHELLATTVTADTVGLHTGDVVAERASIIDITATNVIASNVIGNLNGTATTVQSISTHDITELANVSDTAPQIGDMLVWDGTQYSPANVNSSLAAQPLRMPHFTTSQRNALSAENGFIIYNTTDNKFQGYENGSWVNLV